MTSERISETIKVGQQKGEIVSNNNNLTRQLTEILELVYKVEDAAESMCCHGARLPWPILRQLNELRMGATAFIDNIEKTQEVQG